MGANSATGNVIVEVPNESAAASPAASAGLIGVLKGLWTTLSGNLKVTNPDGSLVGGGAGSVAALASTPLGTITTDQDAAVAAAANLRYCGFSARETTGSAGATFKIVHGATIAGAVIETVTLAAGESTSDRFDGDAAPNGISVDLVSGSVELILKTRAGA